MQIFSVPVSTDIIDVRRWPFPPSYESALPYTYKAVEKPDEAAPPPVPKPLQQQQQQQQEKQNPAKQLRFGQAQLPIEVNQKVTHVLKSDRSWRGE